MRRALSSCDAALVAQLSCGQRQRVSTSPRDERSSIIVRHTRQARRRSVLLRLMLPTRSSSGAITAGSRSVVTSPSARPSAMSRSSRRMILPERVFGRSSAQMMRLGRANLPIRSATVSRMPSTVCSSPVEVALQRHERHDRLAGVLVVLADHRRLGDVRVRHDRRLDLGGREPVAGDVDDVVDAADHPEVAVACRGGRRRRRGRSRGRSA